jgi:hypothetical protein
MAADAPAEDRSHPASEVVGIRCCWRRRDRRASQADKRQDERTHAIDRSTRCRQQKPVISADHWFIASSNIAAAGPNTDGEDLGVRLNSGALMNYRVEYCLGRWPGRVSRSHSGLRALAAIAVDLLMSLICGVIGLASRLVRLTFVATCLIVAHIVGACVLLFVAVFRFLVAVLEAPCRALRRAAAERGPRSTAKPAWVAFDDL